MDDRPGMRSETDDAFGDTEPDLNPTGTEGEDMPLQSGPPPRSHRKGMKNPFMKLLKLPFDYPITFVFLFSCLLFSLSWIGYWYHHVYHKYLGGKFTTHEQLMCRDEPLMLNVQKHMWAKAKGELKYMRKHLTSEGNTEWGNSMNALSLKALSQLEVKKEGNAVETAKTGDAQVQGRRLSSTSTYVLSESDGSNGHSQEYENKAKNNQINNRNSEGVGVGARVGAGAVENTNEVKSETHPTQSHFDYVVHLSTTKERNRPSDSRTHPRAAAKLHHHTTTSDVRARSRTKEVPTFRDLSLDNEGNVRRVVQELERRAKQANSAEGSETQTQTGNNNINNNKGDNNNNNNPDNPTPLRRDLLTTPEFRTFHEELSRSKLDSHVHKQQEQRRVEHADIVGPSLPHLDVLDPRQIGKMKRHQLSPLVSGHWSISSDADRDSDGEEEKIKTDSSSYTIAEKVTVSNDLGFYQHTYGEVALETVTQQVGQSVGTHAKAGNGFSTLVYYRIWKNGNEHIRSLLHQFVQKRRVHDVHDQKCANIEDCDPYAASTFTEKISSLFFPTRKRRYPFTFVRDPVERFLSAYIEIEYNFKDAEMEYARHIAPSRSKGVGVGVGEGSTSTSTSSTGTFTSTAVGASDSPSTSTSTSSSSASTDADATNNANNSDNGDGRNNDSRRRLETDMDVDSGGASSRRTGSTGLENSHSHPGTQERPRTQHVKKATRREKARNLAYKGPNKGRNGKGRGKGRDVVSTQGNKVVPSGKQGKRVGGPADEEDDDEAEGGEGDGDNGGEGGGDNANNAIGQKQNYKSASSSSSRNPRVKRKPAKEDKSHLAHKHLPLKHPIGTVHRFVEFLDMVLLFDGSRSLFRTYDSHGEFHHLAPQIGTLMAAQQQEALPLRLFHLENFKSGWTALSQETGQPRLLHIRDVKKDNQTQLWTPHGASRDSKGYGQGARALLREGMAITVEQLRAAELREEQRLVQSRQKMQEEELRRQRQRSNSGDSSGESVTKGASVGTDSEGSGGSPVRSGGSFQESRNKGKRKERISDTVEVTGNPKWLTLDPYRSAPEVAYVRLLCRLYLSDFVCAGYSLPAVCEDLHAELEAATAAHETHTRAVMSRRSVWEVLISPLFFFTGPSGFGFLPVWLLHAVAEVPCSLFASSPPSCIAEFVHGSDHLDEQHLRDPHSYLYEDHDEL